MALERAPERISALQREKRASSGERAAREAGMPESEGGATAHCARWSSRALENDLPSSGMDLGSATPGKASKSASALNSRAGSR